MMRKKTQPARTFWCPQCDFALAVNSAQLDAAVNVATFDENDQDAVTRLALEKFGTHVIGGVDCAIRRGDNEVKALARLKRGLEGQVARATTVVARFAERSVQSLRDAEELLRWSTEMFQVVAYGNVCTEALAALNGEGSLARTVAQVREYAVSRALAGAREAATRSTSVTGTFMDQQTTAAWAKLARDLAFHLEA